MAPQSRERQRLLQQAVHSFARAHPGYTMARIEREIAQAVGLSQSSVQKWRAGHPIASHHVPALAEWAVRQAGMDPPWLRAFLRQCEYAHAGLEAQLFTAEASPPPPTSNAHRSRFPKPEYLRLFGVEPLIQNLISLLSDPYGPAFVSLEGLGGIGKTALARAASQRLAEASEPFAGHGWISARHRWLTPRGDLESLKDPARSVNDVVTRLAEQLGQLHLTGLSITDKLDRLRPLLREEPYLIVVDNLETLTDILELLPALQPLAGASKFLFTSRRTLRHFPYVHVLTVPRLSSADSEALIRSELERRGQVGDLPAAIMERVYELIGGLPLALKLAAAQIGHLPAKHILRGLERADRQTPQALYTHIYHRAWHQLSAPARDLLLSLLNVSPDGENVSWIRLASTLPASQFKIALAQLLDYSLLEIAQALPEPVYRLHRLTATFLQSEILLDWKNQATDE
jgi:hypothetical protein